MRRVVQDPVCHMELEAGRAPVQRQYGAAAVWFCSLGCAELFDCDPERYLSSAATLSPGAEQQQFQLIIIGGGPAGLTAALYASIQRLHTLLIADQIGGQATESVDMQNYMGFQVIEGRDLVARFRDQLLHAHFVEHRLDRATALTTSSGCLGVKTERGGGYQSAAVILATGMKQRMLRVPGEERLLRRGVSFSVVQDAERFHGCDIAIIGGGNSGLQAAARLAPVGRHLFLLAVGPLTGDVDDISRAYAIPNLTILEHTTVLEVLGSERVEGIRVKPNAGGDERNIDVSGVFVEIGFTPNSGLAAGLVEINRRGEIVVGPDCSTCTPGVFAAGDVTTGYGKRVVIACGDGARAALAAYAYVCRSSEGTGTNKKTLVV